MSYPKIIFTTSADPMHYAHLNSILRGERTLRQPVSLVIVLNPLKPSGMFNVEERKEIAKLYIPPERIFTASSEHEVQEYIRAADYIVKGIRSDEDLAYIERLISLYDATDISNRVVKIPVRPEFLDVSSSLLKQLVKEKRFQEAERFVPRSVIEKVAQKLGLTINQSQISEIDYQVLPARNKDIESIYRLINHCAEEKTLNPRSLEYIEEMLAIGRIVVARRVNRQEEIIGTAWLSPCFGTWELHVAVDSAFRKHGVGIEISRALTCLNETYLAITRPSLARTALVLLGFVTLSNEELVELDANLVNYCLKKVQMKANLGVQNVVAVKEKTNFIIKPV
jgi:phosphopantetheine adenylyltransferase/N-acetylglutamate synthase-like GNAT family acetyltransferase